MYTEQVNFEVPNSSKLQTASQANGGYLLNYNVKVSKPDQRRGCHDQDHVFKSLEIENNMFMGANGRVDRDETMAQLHKIK